MLLPASSLKQHSPETDRHSQELHSYSGQPDLPNGINNLHSLTPQHMTRYLVEAHSESLKESAGDHRLQHVVIGFAHYLNSIILNIMRGKIHVHRQFFYKLKIIRF